jgi:hypothetical protein
MSVFTPQQVENILRSVVSQDVARAHGRISDALQAGRCERSSGARGTAVYALEVSCPHPGDKAAVAAALKQRYVAAGWSDMHVEFVISPGEPHPITEVSPNQESIRVRLVALTPAQEP